MDLVEQSKEFLETAENQYLEGLAKRVQRFIPKGLEEFVPEQERYDLIWCQWVLGHLSDEELVAFLKRCVAGLKPGTGLIGIKENTTRHDDVDFDLEDSSMTRTDAIFKGIFEKAGLTLLKEGLQQGFPASLYPVRMLSYNCN